MSTTSTTTPFTASMDFVPGESRISFPGSVSITKTTLTVFKSNSSAAMAMRDPATNDRLLFIGVCSLPLIQFYRHKNMITLVRGSSFLFDNAALSAGLGHGSRGSDAAGAMISGMNIDNPTMWENITLCCPSEQDCDKVVAALLDRHAEEVFSPPFPIASDHYSSATSSKNSSMPTGTNSYHRHNEKDSQRPASRRPASSHVSERQERRDSAAHRLTKAPTPQDSGDMTSQTRTSTPRSSRLPSRRENDDATPQSARSTTTVNSPSSSRLPSRRENDDATSQSAPSATTPSIRSSRRPVAPGRVVAAPLEEDAIGSRPHSTRRRPVDIIEREFVAVKDTHIHTETRTSSRGRQSDAPLRSSSSHNGRTHSHQRRSRHSTRSPGGERHSTPRSARQSPRGTSSPNTYTDGMDYSTSVSPRSTMSRIHRAEEDGFLRNIQKLQHHRLHFMQYLHKEMVHQAYLAEAEKVRAAHVIATAAAPSSRSSRSPPHRQILSDEKERLREIEGRLMKVEALHREAEREREEAARLRREYEWRNDELTLRLAQQGVPPMGSRDASSELNSSVISPHRHSYGTHTTSNGQLVVAHGSGGSRGQYPLIPHSMNMADLGVLGDPSAGPRPDDVDLGVAIVDRYVFGEEWDRLFPSYEADVRFNAQIDVCLAMKLPRRLVVITNMIVDRPGLRVTAEIHYDRARIERDGVERRMGGCPFRFLQRFYDMRDLFLAGRTSGAAALAGRNGADNAAPRSIGSRPASRHASRHASRTASRHASHQHRRSNNRNSDISSLMEDDDVLNDGDYGNVDARRDQLYRRTEDRVRAAADRMAKQRKKMAAELRRRIAANMDELMEEEEYQRDHLQLEEAKMRKRLGRDANRNAKETLTTSMSNVEEDERIERVTLEVGAARQLHVLMGSHRRHMELLNLMSSEADRRRQISEQERLSRLDLSAIMNPSTRQARALQAVEAELAHRELLRQAEVKARANLLSTMAALMRGCLSASLDDLRADEAAARASIRSQAMMSLLDLLFHAPLASQGRRAPSEDTVQMRVLLREIQSDEAAERQQLIADELRRRLLYQQEDVVVRETLHRDAVELAELDARDAILDSMVHQNRQLLERRITEREQLTGLVNEEQFYRKTIISDEQDAFEVLAELFAAGLKELLSRVPADVESDDENMRRRRISTQRTAKPFHYMTFSPDDMDYPPSAVLAIEGILGCSINKNLEVVSISRPLPKVEEEELQLQAGDMILDVAGHSLHSSSHLREVLSNRAMQIQEEASAEFPDVPEDQLTTNPALQKYIEVLCEHHNFLIQVLRGCEIYQIIVKS